MTCAGVLKSEFERRKEFEKRKKLRLLQVRQQSKEFADNLRVRVKEEVIRQKKIYADSEKKLKQEKHLQELHQLKELYDKCIQSIGESHKEAAKQPNLNLTKEAELARISEQASVRGVVATKKQLENKTYLKKKVEAPIRQKKATRNKENLRSFFISSLPKHVDQPKGHLLSPPKSSNQNKQSHKKSTVLQEIPSNLNANSDHSISTPTERDKSSKNQHNCRSEASGENREHCRKQEPFDVEEATDKPEYNLVKGSSPPEECTCDYIVCGCHTSPKELRRCHSESRISSEKDSDFGEHRYSKLRSRSCSPRSVRTLNYLDNGNVYESNQQSFVKVTHHSRYPEQTKEAVGAPDTVIEGPVSKFSKEDLKKRTDERSAKALRKEQLKRDFQQLIQNLKKLTQEKSLRNRKTKGNLTLHCSERDILEKNENKQRRLNDAFEKLPHSIKHSESKKTGFLQPQHIPIDDSSPPSLNLALYQKNMPTRNTCPSPPVARRVISTEEVTVSSSVGRRPRDRSTCSQSSRARSTSPNVIVNTDPAGDVHITVKVSEVLGKRSKSPSPPSSGSSYLSPPSNLTPSQNALIEALLCHVKKRSLGDETKKYIKQLLNMSRESINELRGHGSRQPHTASSPESDIDCELKKMSKLAEVYAEKVNTLVDMYEQMNSSSGGDSSGYIDPIRAPPRSTPSSGRGPSPLSGGPSTGPRRRGISPTAGIAECTEPSSSSVDLDELLFGDIGELPITEEGHARIQAELDALPDPPPGWNFEHEMRKRGYWEVFNSPSETSRPVCAGAAGKEAFSDRVNISEQENWRDNDFGNEDLNIVVNTESQERAHLEDRVDCQQDFLPPMAVVDSGCSPETVHLQQPCFPSLFLKNSLADQSISDVIECAEPANNFDKSLFKFPLDDARLTTIRQKLYNIYKHKYSEIIEMVQEEANKEKKRCNEILQQTTSDLFLDSIM